MKARYHLTDRYGRPYGISSDSKELILREAYRMNEQENPFGVWLVSDDEDDIGQEIVPSRAGIE